MPDYQLGKIYKIVCNVTGLIYVGSTTEKNLSRRLSNHKSAYKKSVVDNKNCQISSHKIIEGGDFDIVLVENYPCNNKDELYQRENYWYDLIECVNKNRPFNSIQETKEKKKEYYVNNKEKKKEYDREHRLKNRDTLIEKKRMYNFKNKDRISEYNKQYKSKKKEDHSLIL